MRLQARFVAVTAVLSFAFAALTVVPAAAAGGTVTMSIAGSIGVGVSHNVTIGLAGFADGQYQATVKIVDSLGADAPNGVLAQTATTGLAFVFGHQRSSGEKLGFSGSLANVESALDTVTWTPSRVAAGNRLLVTVATIPGTNQFYSSATGRYYEYVSGSNISWSAAKTDAAAKTLNGLKGYLVHITTAAENEFIANETSASDIWIGATDTAADGFLEGEWRWDGAAVGTDAPTLAGAPRPYFAKYSDLITTPDSSAEGYVNWSLTATGLPPVTIPFAGWATDEPNGSTSESCAVTNWRGSKGRWNDLTCAYAGTGYLVEYGGRSDDGANTAVSASAGQDFAVIAGVPSALTVAPTSGSASGNTGLALRGTNFSEATSLTLGPDALTKVADNTAAAGLLGGQWAYQTAGGEIFLKTPERSGNNRTVGAQRVVVSSSGGSSVEAVDFTYRPLFGSPNLARVVLGDLASRSQGKPITRSSTSPFTVTGSDSRSGLVYTYETDKFSTGRSAYLRESVETVGSLTLNETGSDSNVQILSSAGSCTHGNGSPSGAGGVPGGSTEAYCSVFGPEIYTEAFYATSSQALAFQWKAEGGGDDYEIYAFLVSVDNVSDIPTPSLSNNELLVHSMGQTMSAYTTSSANIPRDGLYRFRFVNGTYDFTGGKAIGAKMFIKKDVVIGTANVISFPALSDRVAATSDITDSFSFTLSSTSSAEVAISKTGPCITSSSFSAPTTTVTVTKTSGLGACAITASQGASAEYAPAGNITRAFDYRAASVAPTAPSVVGLVFGAGSVQVAFNPPGRDGGSAVTNYQYSLDGSTYTPLSPPSTVSPVTISGLVGGTTYAVTLKAVNAAGVSPASNSLSGTAPAAPVAPTAPSVVGLVFGAGSVQVAFNPPGGDGGSAVTNYQYSLDGSTYTPLSPPSTVSPVTISGLVGGVTYAVTLKAVNAAGVGPASNSLSGTAPGAPSAPLPNPAPAVTPPTPEAPTTARIAPRSAPAPAALTGPVLRGSAPPVPSATPSATVNGRPAVVTSTVTGSSGVSLRAGSFTVGMTVPQNQGGVTRQGTATQVNVQQGASTPLQGSGVLPGSTVQVFLPLQGGNAKEIGRIASDSTGSFSGTALFATGVTEAPMPVGRQVLQVVSVAPNGQQTVVEMTINIGQSAPAPESNRQTQQLPALAPGASLATEAGIPVSVRVSALEEQKQVTVEGDGWSMAVDVTGEGGTVRSTEGGAVMELVRNETALVSGSGFLPGSRADVWLFSTPTLLGTVTIDADGNFVGEINVDPNAVAVGEHTLQVQAVGQDGYVRAANVGVVVSDPVTEVAVSTYEVAGTFLWWLWLLIALLVTAAVIAGIRYSRRARA